MVSEYLPAYDENAALTLIELLPLIDRGEVNFQLLLVFCQNYRIKGITALLLECDSEKLGQNLSKSARAFIHGLKLASEIELVSSQFTPFFDAIACGDFEAASLIAEASTKSPNLDCEYEDDFLYFKFLMQYFLSEEGTSTQEETLNKYEELLAGDSDPRFNLCRALFLHDLVLFDESLQDFLSMYDERFRRLDGGFDVAPEIVATEGYICIEGLALLRVAENLGMVLDNEYLLIPSLVRHIKVEPMVSGSWRQLE